MFLPFFFFFFCRIRPAAFFPAMSTTVAGASEPASPIPPKSKSLFEKWIGSWRLQRELFDFYMPIAIASASQSLTYPLVSSIVSHGCHLPLESGGFDGALEFAAFSQGQALMFLLGALGIGLGTSGMVFAKSRTGQRNYERLTSILTVITAVLQILCCVPPFDRLVFGTILGLSPELLEISRNTTLLSVPMQWMFYSRSKYLPALYLAKKSNLANRATLYRIGLTALLSPVFNFFGLVGYVWGAVAMTTGVWVELALTRAYSKPLREALEDAPELEKASVMRQFLFMLPLSFGGILLSMTGFLIAIFLAKAPDPTVALSIHYILMGFINPFGFAALRTSTVTICFPPEKYGRRPVTVFSLLVGLVCCSFSFFMQIPALSRWYFGSVQNLSPELVKLATFAALVVAPIPVVQALRGNAEGLAANRRRPNAIMASQAVFLSVLAISLFTLTAHPHLVPGYLIGAVSLFLSMIGATLTLYVALIANDLADQYHIAANEHSRGAPTGVRF